MIIYKINITDTSDGEVVSINFKNKMDADFVRSKLTDIVYHDPCYTIFGTDFYDKNYDIEIFNTKNNQNKINLFKKIYKDTFNKDCDWEDSIILGIIFISEKFNYLVGAYVDYEIIEDICF